MGTTPTPSPMNMGATVTITLSTRGERSALRGACRNDERILEPPSIMTLRNPSILRMSGRSFGGIRPAAVSLLESLKH